MLRPAALGLGLVAVALLAQPALAAEGSTIGEVHWPQHESLDALVSDLVDLLEAEDPVVVGHPPTEAIEVQGIDETRSRVTIHDRDGQSGTYVQDHQPRERLNGTQRLHIGAEHLEPSVHVVREPFETFVQVYAPPGGFDVAAESPDQAIAEVRDRLDVPVGDEEFFHLGQFRLLALDGACALEGTSACQAPALFSLARETVSFQVRWMEPRNALQIGDEHPNRTIVGPSYLAAFAFQETEGEQRLVGVSLPLVFEADRSAVLDPDEARERVAEAVREQGGQLVDGDGQPASPAEAIRGPNFRLELGERLSVDRVQYRWETQLVNETGEDPVSLRAFSDPVTGEVTSIRYRPLHEPPDADGEPSRSTAGLGVAAIGAGLAFAARRAGRSA